MNENNANLELNQPKKKLKQTSIRDFFSNTDKNQEMTESSSTLKLNEDPFDSECVATDVKSSQDTDISEIPETPEHCLIEEPTEEEEMDCEDDIQLFNGLNRLTNCLLPLSPLRSGSNQFVLFNVPISRTMDSVPNPFPDCYTDQWDGRHVKMPNSSNNKITSVQTNDGQTVRTRVSKWELIERNLLSDINCCTQLVEAIKTYNPFCDNYDFDVLNHFFHEICSAEETIEFFDQILPKMIDLALSLPQIVTQSVPLLRQKQNSCLFLSQQQIACLLANAFFCTFPKRSHYNEEYKNYPNINFLSLFTSFQSEECLNTKVEKLKCIFRYFKTVIEDMPKGIVSFERRYLSKEELPFWYNSNKTLRKLVVMKNGVIETEGKGLLQVDFANKLIGGGVIGSGCVQEEIRFLICPELIISRLFTEKLLDTEVVLINGCQQYSTYSGYSHTFEWTGIYEDQTPFDEWGRRMTRIVAMDALFFSSNQIDIQFKTEYFERELNKAFSGFLERRNTDPKNKCGIASGNWGCGAFNGDPFLKAIIQLMAASQVDRDLVIFTFNDSFLKRRLESFYSFVTKHKFCVKDLFKGVVLYNRYHRRDKNLDVLQYIQNNYQLILDN